MSVAWWTPGCIRSLFRPKIQNGGPDKALWQLVKTRNWNALFIGYVSNEKKSQFFNFPLIHWNFWNFPVERRINVCSIYISNRNFRNLYKMESAWQLSLLVYQRWTFFDVTLRRRHKICFCDFSDWTRTSQIYRLWKIGIKERTLLYFLVRFSLMSLSLFPEVSVIF